MDGVATIIVSRIDYFAYLDISSMSPPFFFSLQSFQFFPQVTNNIQIICYLLNNSTQILLCFLFLPSFLPSFHTFHVITSKYTTTTLENLLTFRITIIIVPGLSSLHIFIPIRSTPQSTCFTFKNDSCPLHSLLFSQDSYTKPLLDHLFHMLRCKYLLNDISEHTYFFSS